MRVIVRRFTGLSYHYLEGVKVSSYFHGSSDDYDVPVVESSLTFSKIRMQYTEDGRSISAGWDFTTNKPL